MQAELARKLFSLVPLLEKERLKIIQDAAIIEQKKSDLENVSAVKFNGSHNQNPVAISSILCDLISREYEIGERYDQISRLLENINDLIDMLPSYYKDVVVEKYYDGYSWDYVADKRYCSRQTLLYQLDNELEKIEPQW